MHLERRMIESLLLAGEIPAALRRLHARVEHEQGRERGWGPILRELVGATREVAGEGSKILTRLGEERVVSLRL